MEKVVLQEDVCKRCGRCCRNLSMYERLLLSIYTRSFIWSRECTHLTEGNLCSVYGDRHYICRDWECGVFLDED